VEILLGGRIDVNNQEKNLEHFTQIGPKFSRPTPANHAIGKVSEVPP
jgi:hypothetical protein